METLIFLTTCLAITIAIDINQKHRHHLNQDRQS